MTRTTERVTRLSMKKNNNPTVNIRPLTIEDLLSIMRNKSSVGGNSADEATTAASKQQILEEKIEVLEKELCRKNQIIRCLQEEIQTLKTEGDNSSRNLAGTVSDDSFSLEENCGMEVDLNISIQKLLRCKAIAKRRAEQLGGENQLDNSSCSLVSETENTVLTEEANVPVDVKEDSQEQSRTPKSAAKGQRERRPYRKKKVPASSVKNMSAWLALARKETVDTHETAKRKRSEEAEDESAKRPQENIPSQEENNSLKLKIKSFASQYAQELNVVLCDK